MSQCRWGILYNLGRAIGGSEGSYLTSLKSQGWDGKTKISLVFIAPHPKLEKEILFAENAPSLPYAYIAYKLCLGADIP